ncbi:UPF0104 family protein [Spirulina major CS-329]|uniref:UPF0104 family protein n=1 Tax=Spirulina TaxID=1154 RepID=UPI00232BF854|nr:MULTISPECIES: UPF0104 family protein [Spirulina]MDB9497030.1 UPF0104 family protein [Spirulina subsalsa CS-330]MDB9505378.1 UPF0104 family protein [Spirulina major CS-329]
MKRWMQRMVRSLIVGGALFFLASTLRHHWQQITPLTTAAIQWPWIAAGFVVTLLAHSWSGWVWGWILADLAPQISPRWAIATYLQTTIAKYIPGNVWHLYGRIHAAQTQGLSLTAATFSTLIEPLLMAAAAILVALLTWPVGITLWQPIALLGILITIHPQVLNLGLRWLARWKRSDQAPMQLHHYPWRPFGGEVIFVGLRALGFYCTVAGLMPVAVGELPRVVSAFAIAWVLGLVLPGAPGGLGVFESVAVALLSSQYFFAIALYRLSNTLAEAVGAGLASLIQSPNQ